MKSKVHEELKQHFKPEFLNRVDDVVVFPQLKKTELLQIVESHRRRLGERLLDHDMSIELSQPARSASSRSASTPRSVRARSAGRCSARSRIASAS